MKFLLILFLLIPIKSYAGLTEGVEAFNRKEYSNAFKEFEDLASKGEVESMHYLGIMYERGFGVPLNLDKAYDYYSKAAEAGDGKSALKMGQAYQTGIGRPQNTKAAYKWFVEAAKKNNDEAQYIIGNLYFKDDNFERANQLFMLSAMQGNSDAQFELGNIYFEGNGVPQDYTQAISWYNLSANQGNVSAQLKLADLYSSEAVKGVVLNPVMAHFWYNLIAAYNSGMVREDAIKRREEIIEKMKPEMIMASQKKASEWRKKTKEESIPKVKDGRIYSDVELKASDVSLITAMKNETKVTETVKNELEEPVDVQAVNIGINQELVKNAIKQRDFLPVLSATQPIADRGITRAMNLLGDLYSQNITGVPKDYHLAAKWYNMSAQKGDVVGQFKLGTMFCEGKGVDPNLVECYKWFLIVENRVSPDAMKYLRSAMSKVTNALDEQETRQAVELANRYKTEVLKLSPVLRDDNVPEISESDLNEISDTANKKILEKNQEKQDDTIIKGVEKYENDKTNENKSSLGLF